MIGKVFSHYTITGELGKGGMGEVYLAIDTVLERQVGLKFLAPSLQSNPVIQKRFLREAKTAAALDHPYICKIYEIGEDHGQAFIAMEYVEGQTIDKKITAGAIPFRESLHLAAEIAEAMEEAHRRGIVHRDLKPSNLMITHQGHIKVMDFGLAKQVATSAGQMTATGGIAGTMDYMSPEQARGEELDSRSDIFSLGLVFYFIFTGAHPFRRSSLIDTVHAAMNEPPKPMAHYLTGVPPALTSMIEKMLAKNPADRYSSIGEPLKILKELLSDPRTSLGTVEGATIPAQTRIESGATDSERRLLTAIFCELADFPDLAETLDPEELHEITEAFRATFTGPITRLQGRIVEARDNGVLAYFGYPAAHEDDALRAVRAGLEGVQAVTADAGLKRVPVHARVGIDTGLVIVSGTVENPTFVGKPAHVAGLLPAGMPADSVTVSLATRQLVESHFVCEDAGLVTLKGYRTPTNIYRVRNTGSTQGHLRPLIGRMQEMGLLMDRWERVESGSGQAVVLTGEAGIGKSRLLEALKDRLSASPHVLIEFRCSPYYSGSAMYPVVDSFERVLQLTAEDSPAVRWEKLEKVYQSYGIPFDAAAPLMGAMLSLPPSPRYALPNLTPEGQKRKTQDALVDFALQISERRPVFLVVEDIHWIDPSTLELLNLLLDQLPTSHIFMLATSRPTSGVTLSPRSYLTPVSLSPLSRKESENLVDSMIGGKHLPVAVLQMVLAKTDGVPLFVEEFTRMVIESVLKETGGGYELTRSLPAVDIPTTLQQSLMARLDRMGDAKDVAQIAATIGRTFSYDLLAAVSGTGERELQRKLDRLVDAELLFRRGLPPHCSYVFKHGLIQDAAYQSLVKATRRQHHDRIARVLEERFPEMASTAPEILAHHHTEAGNIIPAVSYWLAAGQRAIQQSADIEAIDKARRGLALVKQLPDGPSRIQQELTLQTILGPGLIATKGYAAPEVEEVYTRARQLCSELGDPPQVFPVLFGLWTYYLVRSELSSARELALHLSKRAVSANDPDLIMQADMALGWTCYFSGEPLAARIHLEKGIAGYDAGRHQKHSYIYGQEPGMAGKACLSCVLWLLGYPEEAARNSAESLLIAEQSHHHNSMAFALCVAGWFHQHSGDLASTRAVAEKTIALTREQHLPYFLAMATITMGWAVSQMGEPEQGMAQIRAGLLALEATGGRNHYSYFTCLLAEVCGQQGRTAEALELLDSTFSRMEASGERCWEVEVHRLRGIQLWASTPPDLAAAEAAFRTALELSLQRQERATEIRVESDLAHLLEASRS